MNSENEIKHRLLDVCKVKGWDSDINLVGFHALCDELKALGADDEREACAKVCEKVAVDSYTRIGGEHEPYMRATAEDCARHIRARGQSEERNFCPRCGKRTADLTTIHTCTPPQGNT